MAHRSEEIATRVPHDRDIYGVEVGVRYGKNAAHLLRMLPRLHLTLVDPWRKPAPGDSYYDSGDGIADRPAGHFEKCYREAMERVAPYKERVDVWRETSQHAAARRFVLTGFDFVFLDGDHSYAGVCDDINLWLPLVRPGGILCGHDYAHPNIHGVRRAVDELLGDVELGGDMTWFYRVT